MTFRSSSNASMSCLNIWNFASSTFFIASSLYVSTEFTLSFFWLSSSPCSAASLCAAFASCSCSAVISSFRRTVSSWTSSCSTCESTSRCSNFSPYSCACLCRSVISRLFFSSASNNDFNNFISDCSFSICCSSSVDTVSRTFLRSSSSLSLAFLISASNSIFILSRSSCWICSRSLSFWLSKPAVATNSARSSVISSSMASSRCLMRFKLSRFSVYCRREFSIVVSSSIIFWAIASASACFSACTRTASS
mmetsp:Transcript_26727/g.45088  ORF Transcript_26727/g.45088 Transcript_26727/m.45088 type:complete len:251 (+) Transcript_26727:427-1179(+)